MPWRILRRVTRFVCGSICGRHAQTSGRVFRTSGAWSQRAASPSAQPAPTRYRFQRVGAGTDTLPAQTRCRPRHATGTNALPAPTKVRMSKTKLFSQVIFDIPTLHGGGALKETLRGENRSVKGDAARKEALRGEKRSVEGSGARGKAQRGRRRGVGRSASRRFARDGRGRKVVHRRGRRHARSERHKKDAPGQ